MSTTRVRILLVDDHTVVRQGLRRVLETNPDFEVVGEVGTGAAALAETPSLLPDVVIMDVNLPDMSGVDATRTLTAKIAGLRVLMLSMHAEDAYVAESLSAGAGGYVLKDDDDNELATAIRTVARGQRYLSTRIASSATETHTGNTLSPRERDVLALIGAGLGNRQIAERLAVSVNTVETHRRHIIEKLNLHSTAELVRYALRHQIAD